MIWVRKGIKIRVEPTHALRPALLHNHYTRKLRGEALRNVPRTCKNTPGVCAARVVRATRVVRVWQACYVSHTCHAGPVCAARNNDALRYEVARCVRPASAARRSSCSEGRNGFATNVVTLVQGLQCLLKLHGAVTARCWGFMPHIMNRTCGTELSRIFLTGNILSFPGTFCKRS